MSVFASGHSDKLTLIVVVNGEPVKVKAAVTEPLEAIIPEALKEAKVTGRPPEDWDLKDEHGTLYDRSKPTGDFDFPSEFVIYLSLRAGEAG